MDSRLTKAEKFHSRWGCNEGDGLQHERRNGRVLPVQLSMSVSLPSDVTGRLPWWILAADCDR